jgi:hypothetical protein
MGTPATRVVWKPNQEDIVMNTVETKELDLRNLDIVTEVADKGALMGVDTSEPWEIWTITFNTGG